jgi:hypothetical protein
MRFSQQANVEMDSPLCVDPPLLYEDEDSDGKGLTTIMDFFDATLDLLKQAQGHRESMHCAKAQRFIQFPSPKSSRWGSPWDMVQESAPSSTRDVRGTRVLRGAWTRLR